MRTTEQLLADFCRDVIAGFRATYITGLCTTSKHWCWEQPEYRERIIDHEVHGALLDAFTTLGVDRYYPIRQEGDDDLQAEMEYDSGELWVGWQLDARLDLCRKIITLVEEQHV